MTWKKKAVGILWLGMVSLIFGQKEAAPPETFRPSYADGDWTRLSVRQDVVYRRDIKASSAEGAPVREFQDCENIGFELVIRNLSKNADGSRDLEVEYRRKWREAWRDIAPAAVADYSAVAGKKMTFRLLPDGTVEGLKGYEDFPEVINPLSRQAIPKTDFMYDILYLFPKFPDKPISIGSTWEAPIFVLPSRSVSPPVYHYRVIGRVKKKGEDCLRIVATDSTKSNAERPVPEIGMAKAENSNQGIYVYYFSLKKGMIIAKSLSWQGDQTLRKDAWVINEVKTLAMYECAVTFD
jgi:hypothetical protein